MTLFVGEEILFTSHRRLITISGFRSRKHAALKALSRRDVLFADIFDNIGKEAGESALDGRFFSGDGCRFSVVSGRVGTGRCRFVCRQRFPVSAFGDAGQLP